MTLKTIKNLHKNPLNSTPKDAVIQFNIFIPRMYPKHSKISFNDLIRKLKEKKIHTTQKLYLRYLCTCVNSTFLICSRLSSLFENKTIELKFSIFLACSCTLFSHSTWAFFSSSNSKAMRSLSSSVWQDKHCKMQNTQKPYYN